MPTYVRVFERDIPKGARNIKRVENGSGPIFYKVGHTGKVVETHDRYEGDNESSYWATVSEGGAFKSICIGSDRTSGYAEIDAPQVLMARWVKHEAARKEKLRVEAAKEAARREAERQAFVMTQPHRDTIVEVVKGRLVPKGFVGRVTWLGDSTFGPRLRIVDEASGTAYFIAAANVKVLSQPAGFRP